MTEGLRLSRLKGCSLARMNGVGNAIVVLDLRGCDIVVTEDEARAICAAPGLAFDQLMVTHDPDTKGVDAFVRIYNADGSLSGACGNGTRCVAWFLLRESDRDHLRLSTSSGQLVCHRLDPTHFSVDMGPPAFSWDKIPLRDENLDPRAVDLGPPEPYGRPFALSVGNPHAVFFVPDTDAVDLLRFGPPVENASAFPERANVSFAQVISRETIKLRVWERGAGATLGCGSGACASVIAGASTGRTARAADVHLPGGTLRIDWRDDDHVVMAGPIELEFEGTIDEALIGSLAA